MTGQWGPVPVAAEALGSAGRHPRACAAARGGGRPEVAAARRARRGLRFFGKTAGGVVAGHRAVRSAVCGSRRSATPLRGARVARARRRDAVRFDAASRTARRGASVPGGRAPATGGSPPRTATARFSTRTRTSRRSRRRTRARAWSACACGTSPWTRPHARAAAKAQRRRTRRRRPDFLDEATKLNEADRGSLRARLRRVRPPSASAASRSVIDAAAARAASSSPGRWAGRRDRGGRVGASARAAPRARPRAISRREMRVEKAAPPSGQARGKADPESGRREIGRNRNPETERRALVRLVLAGRPKKNAAVSRPRVSRSAVNSALRPDAAADAAPAERSATRRRLRRLAPLVGSRAGCRRGGGGGAGARRRDEAHGDGDGRGGHRWRAPPPTDAACSPRRRTSSRTAPRRCGPKDAPDEKGDAKEKSARPCRRVMESRWVRRVPRDVKSFVRAMSGVTT